MSETSGRAEGAGDAQFHTTRWSVVLCAKEGEDGARPALEQLCAIYWYPLYAYLRRKGAGAHQAEDVVQGFFTAFLEKDYLNDVERSRGRFRSFLLASLNHYFLNTLAYERAEKRGGKHKVVALNGSEAESRYGAMPTSALTPERLFDRQWALAVLDQVLRRLGEDYVQQGKGAVFEGLKPTLTGGTGATRLKDIAGELNMSETAVRTAAHRLRKRYRELLRAEIAQTVATEEDVEDEIRHLLSCL